MNAALAPRAPSLFELEHELESLLDTEALVTPEQEAEFRRELASALEASVEKRDRVYAFLRCRRRTVMPKSRAYPSAGARSKQPKSACASTCRA
jgi:hypothetical protein